MENIILYHIGRERENYCLSYFRIIVKNIFSIVLYMSIALLINLLHLNNCAQIHSFNLSFITVKFHFVSH